METKRLQKMFALGTSLLILGNVIEVERNIIVMLIIGGFALIIGAIIPLITEKYSTDERVRS